MKRLLVVGFFSFHVVSALQGFIGYSLGSSSMPLYVVGLTLRLSWLLKFKSPIVRRTRFGYVLIQYFLRREMSFASWTCKLNLVPCVPEFVAYTTTKSVLSRSRRRGIAIRYLPWKCPAALVGVPSGLMCLKVSYCRWLLCIKATPPCFDNSFVA